jgi:hypothetical protein
MAETLYNMPSIGNTEMGLLVSQKVLPMMFADLAFHKGYMVDDRYTPEALQSLEVLIPRIKRPTGKFNNFRAAGYDVMDPSRDRIGQEFDNLSIKWVYNEQIDVAEEEIAQNITGEQIPGVLASRVSAIVTEEMNKITGIEIYNSSLSYNENKPVNERKISYFNPSEDSMPDKFAEMNAYIGNADPVYGDTSFNNRQISGVISNSAYAIAMRTKNQIILESSAGQEILLEGKFGKITLANVKAYRGKVQGVHLFVLPDNFFPSNTNYTNFANYSEESSMPDEGKVYGVFGVAEATYRAFVDRGVKMVDSVGFRGWAMQPLYRTGVLCAKPWGTALLVSSDFHHPKTAVKPVKATVNLDGEDPLEFEDETIKYWHQTEIKQYNAITEVTVPVNTTTTSIVFDLNEEVEIIGTPEVKVYIGEEWISYGAVTVDGSTLTVTPSGDNGESGNTPVERDFRLASGSFKSVYTGISNQEVNFKLNIVSA